MHCAALGPLGRRKGTATAGRPRMPQSIKDDPVAADKWRELVRLLAGQKKLTKLDGPQLELVCSTYSSWQALLADVRKYGQVIEQTWIGKDGVEYTKRVANPAAKMEVQTRNSYHAMLREIGATPVSRERAKPAKLPEKPPEPGSMGEVLSRPIGAAAEYHEVLPAAEKELITNAFNNRTKD